MPKTAIATKAVIKTFLSGWCGPGSASHDRCKGAVTNEDGTVSLCRCGQGCHDGQSVCHRCRYDHAREPQGFDPATRQCLDRDSCQAEQSTTTAHLMATDPLMLELARCRQLGMAEKAANAVVRAARKAEDVAREASGTEAPGETEKPTRAKGTPKEAQRCHCGCSGMTKGGRFVAGHDMRLKSALYRVARGTGTGQMKIDAVVELLARGWSLKDVNPTILTTAQKQYAKIGELDAIAAAVERRYANAK